MSSPILIREKLIIVAFEIRSLFLTIISLIISAFRFKLNIKKIMIDVKNLYIIDLIHLKK